MIARANTAALGSLTAAVALALDQGSKQWVLGRLSRPGDSIALPGPVDLILLGLFLPADTKAKASAGAAP